MSDQNPLAAAASGRAPLPPGRRRAALGLTVVSVLLVVACAALAVLLKGNLDDRQARRDARAGALAAARQAIVNLDSISYTTVDKDMQRVLDGATGTFAQQFGRARADLKAQIVQRKSVSTGEVLSAAVVRYDVASATVLIAAERTVKDRTDTQGGTAHDRWRLDLEKRKGRWLVADLEPVA